MNNWDQLDKDLVFGYIRQNDTNNIPKEIMKIILMYYHEIEGFSVGGKDIVIIQSDNWGTAFGTILLDPTINRNVLYEWTVKINPAPRMSTTWFGIDCIDNIDYHKNTNISNGKNCYAIYVNGNWFCGNAKINRKYHDGRKRFKSGDYFKMIVNLQNETLKYYHNRKYLGIATNKIDLTKKYVMVVTTTGTKSKIELIHFKKKYL